MQRTIHISFNALATDRGDLYALFRQTPHFELFAFYQKYCFVRYQIPLAAHQAIQTLVSQPGISSIVPAKHNYSVPYPQVCLVCFSPH